MAVLIIGQPLRYTIRTNTEPLRRERMTHMNRDMTQLVDGADTLVRRDSALEQMVEEEILPYLAGDCSAEDCARNIQRRVSLLLAEGA